MAFTWILRKPGLKPASAEHDDSSSDIAGTIQLRVEDGLLMAFGPDGDPMPPELVKSACADDPNGTLQLESGGTVDRRCALRVLDAQRKAPLSDERNDGWIEAMLCLGGVFETTAPELLASEPIGTMPSRAKDRDGQAPATEKSPETEVVTKLAFDKTECRGMKKADALLFHGLGAGVTLSAGQYDSTLDGWVLRPNEIPSLAIRRSENAPRRAEIDVTAIALQGRGKRWPIAKKAIELA